jgi:3-hexulose-6-phosphate synthase
MKLQLALDLLDVDAVRRLLDQVIDLIDIVEIGTPLILQEGMRIVTEIKERHPTVTLLADLKIMDAGELEAKIGFDAGADIVTVLGVTHDSTIQGALNQAHRRGKQVMVDLIAVNDVQTRTRELELLGVDSLCVHTAFDVQKQGQGPLRELQLVESVRKRTKIAVAGGIKPDTLPEILIHHPDVVIVGGFVTGHADKRRAVNEIRQVLGSAK